MISKEQKPSMLKKIAVTTAASLALFGANTINAEATTNVGTGNAQEVAAWTKNNILPKVAGSVLRLCAQFPSNCSLKGLPDHRYMVSVLNVPDPDSRIHSFSASFSGIIDGELRSFDTTREFNDTYSKSALANRDEAICDTTTMGDTCFASVSSGSYEDSTNLVAGTFGGLPISSIATDGNVRTTKGNVRNFIVHPYGAKYLAAYAAAELEKASL